MAPKVTFSTILKTDKGTTYIGDKNDVTVSNYNAHLNTYFNIDVQQSAYFTMHIEGWEYGRFHASFKSSTATTSKDGRRDYYYNDNDNKFTYSDAIYTGFSNFSTNDSIFWMPLKSLQYSQGSIETMSLACGAFADIQLPFRKHSPVLTVETYDHRSDFYEMKLREWHSQSVLTAGYVPVLESIVKDVTIRQWSTNGECNAVTKCQCILADDISTSRSYEGNDLKVVSFKLVVVGY